MGGFAFEVTCLRLVDKEPLFGVYAVPVDGRKAFVHTNLIHTI